MFERFTEKSIKVVTFSQEEAAGLKHSKLYPEHILLGIMREGSGIASRFLRAAGIKIEVLRESVSVELETKFTNSSENLSFSNAVKVLFKETWDDARALGANYIAPEHLFLSLLSDENSSVVKILKDLNVDIKRIKDSVKRIVERKSNITLHPEGLQKSHYSNPKFYSVSDISKESELIQILNSAQNKLESTKYETLGTEQIFLSLLENPNTYFCSLLEQEGITHQNFTEKLGSFESREKEYNPDEFQFTPKAYFAINAAYEIAKELGSATIKPEYILLGILREKGGIAYKILEDFGINTESLYDKVIKPIEKQKPVTLTIIRLAREEARRLGHNVVGTELILLGMLGEGTGIGAKVLQDLGVTIKDARMEVEKIIGYGDGYLDKEINFTPRAKKLLEVAWAKAKKFNQQRIESEHLLLGITKEKGCIAMKVLESLGADALEIRQGILKEIENKTACDQHV